MIVNKSEQTCQIIDEVISVDTAVREKEEEKIEKYQDLARELGKMRKVKAKILPVVIGELGTVPRRLESFLSCMGVNTPVELIQKTTLLGAGCWVLER